MYELRKMGWMSSMFKVDIYTKFACPFFAYEQKNYLLVKV